MRNPLYDLLLMAHVVSAVIGFGAVAVAGLWASRGRRAVDPLGNTAVKRFFGPGIDWPARLIFLVPLFGLGLLFGGDRSAVHTAWPWFGLGIWLLAAGAATAWGWPAERRAQRALAAGQVEEFRVACYQMETAAGIISICAVFALLVMIFQP